VKPAPLFLDDAKALAEAAREWSRAAALAIDTEFVRVRTFYARLGLVQVRDDRRTYLVDTVAIEDLGPLGEALASPDVLKIVHSGSEDLEVLLRRLGSVPEPIFDTQIAAVLLGAAPPPSYQRLVGERLGIAIEKGETRTDWMRRPLSAAQLAYAAEDVEHLPALFAHLRRELEGKDRWRWALEDSARLVTAARRENDPEEAYLRFRSLARFSPAQRAALQRLAAWREREARGRDLPRRTVLSDELLHDLAAKRPHDLAGLKALRSYDARAAGRDGEIWLELLRTAPAKPESALAAEPLSSEEEARLATLRAAVEARAKDLGLAPEVLLTRRGMEAIVRRREKSEPAAAGWRGEVLAGL